MPQDVELSSIVVKDDAQAVAAPNVTSAVAARRRAWKLALGGLLVAAVIVGVALAIAYAAGSSNNQLNVPETFRANFALQPTDGGLSASGTMHKTINAKGEWVITGWVQVQEEFQTTTVVAANDGSVYYTVQANGDTLKQECVDPNRAAPQLQSLQDMLESVKSVANNRDASQVQLPAGCTAERSYSFVFQGLSMLICQTNTGAFLVSGRGVSGSIYDMDTTVSPVSTVEPVLNVTTGAVMACPAILPVRAATSSASQRRLDTETTTYLKICSFSGMLKMTCREVAQTVTCKRLSSTKQQCTTCRADRDYCESCLWVNGQKSDFCETVGNMNSAGPATQASTFSAPPAESSTTSTPTRQKTRLQSSGVDVGTSASNLPSFGRCVFVHGSGVVPPAGSNGVRTTFPEYWGQAHDHVNCATKVFMEVDTTNQAWDAPALRSAFCTAAASANDNVIHNTIVLAHGSGNLIVGAAVATGACSFDGKTSAWVELQASYNAARNAEVAEAVCSVRASWDSRQQAVQDEQHFCSDAGKTAAAGWTSVLGSYVPTGVTWDQVAQVIKTGVAGAMCGDYSAGLLASTQWSIGPKVTNTAENDVAWSTCWDAAYHNQFSVEDYTSAFYAPSVNFWDVTCRNGDGMFGSHRQPCGWMGAVAHA